MQLENKNAPLVFLHGWRGKFSSWEDNIAFLKSAGYKCLAIKLPGFDLSEPNVTWGVPEYAKFVVDVIFQEFGESKCVIIGHSFGGRIAIYIAAHYPEIVDILILTDSAGLNLEPQFVRKTLYALAGFSKRLLPFKDMWLQLFGSKDYKEASPVMREVLKNVVNLDLTKDLAYIKCKCLIIWGDKDLMTPLTIAKKFHEGILNSRLVVIKGAEHQPYRTHSNEWNKIVLGFLESEI